MDLLAGERIIQRPIEDEMRDSYLDYSMSVIVQRALPDIRDGLKPVHRRILYGMSELGVGADKPYKKSARIVGDVMGKYHPHGDAAIYDALVRMTQPFAMRYPLIDGQGNFGSIDGDGPAAMRYTEARLHRLAEEMLADIDKETVPFISNYDDTLKEPLVLPSRFPNLLVNGSSGIAVGMATNIPPHNLCEVVDGLVALIDHPDLSIDQLMQYIPGPDFPTGGLVYGLQGIRESYLTGRGKITVRARAFIESPRNARDRIVVTEIPFQVDKSRLIQKIAELVNEKKIEGIADIRDESDREGMRLVIEVKRDADPQVVLNNLFLHSPLQSTFGVIMLALVNGVPRVVNLKTALEEYLKHRYYVITRRTQFDLARAREREHIYEGLKIAVDHLDEVISIIRQSSDTPTARASLMERFGLSEVQASEILDMRLARLTALERRKIAEELKNLHNLILDLEDILARPERVRQIVKEELLLMKEQYGDERRTELIAEPGEFRIEDTITQEEMVITITHNGYIKRYPVSGYRRQRRGGKGLTGHIPRQEDAIRHLFVASTHHYLLIFTAKGKLFWLKVHEIPALGRAARGRPIVNMIEVQPDDRIAALVNVDRFDEDRFILFVTRYGVVKKVPLSEFSKPRRSGITAINLEESDELVEAALTNGRADIVLGASNGRAVRFYEGDVRPMGRYAVGVRGMKLDRGERIIGMVVVRREGTLFTCTTLGYGKRTPVSEFRLTHRGARGVIAHLISEQTGPLCALLEVVDQDDLLLITSSGMLIRQPVNAIRISGRVTKGVRLIRLEEGDSISDVAKVVKEDEEEGSSPAEGDGAEPELFDRENEA